MILDTNALSALGNNDPAILHRLRLPSTPKPYFCFICLGEYRMGLLNSPRPQEPLAMLERLCSSWDTLHSDDETITHYAEIGYQLKMKGRPIPSNHSCRPKVFDLLPSIQPLSGNTCYSSPSL